MKREKLNKIAEELKKIEGLLNVKKVATNKGAGDIFDEVLEQLFKGHRAYFIRMVSKEKDASLKAKAKLIKERMDQGIDPEDIYKGIYLVGSDIDFVEMYIKGGQRLSLDKYREGELRRAAHDYILNNLEF